MGKPGFYTSPKYFPCPMHTFIAEVEHERKVLNAPPGTYKKPKPFPQMRDNLDGLPSASQPTCKYGHDVTTYRLFCKDWDEDECWAKEPWRRSGQLAPKSSVSSARSVVLADAQAQRIRAAA